MKRKVIVEIIEKLELVAITFVFNFFYVRFENNNYSIKIKIFIYFLLTKKNNDKHEELYDQHFSLKMRIIEIKISKFQ